MKRWLVIGLAALLVVVVVGAVGIAGLAYARAQDSDTPFTFWRRTVSTQVQNFTRRGMMSGGMMAGGQSFGMMAPGAHGAMGEYMLEALANAFGLTVEELQTRLQAGDTPWDIAQEQGLSEEEFRSKLVQAAAAALGQMVADGVISQEQSELMLSHMTEMIESSGGFGMMGFSGRMHGMGRGFGGPEGDAPLQPYMQPAIAEAFGLSVEELQARKEAGDNLTDLAVEQGLTVEQFRDLLFQARTTAIDTALEAGVITQEQADRMLERLENSEENGFGLGFKPGFGPGGGGCPGHGGWGDQP
jgi:uncharacterized protein YidB (DUF937 family)